MIAIPVVAGVLAISTGVGVAFAKGPVQDASYRNISDNITTPAAYSSNDSTPVVHCGGLGGMMGLGVGQGLGFHG